MNLKSVVQRLEKFAPSSLAEGWDNVGLLIQPMNSGKVIKNVMITNDLTESVMKEAVERKTDLIISYHPPIFRPLKRITKSSWKERITALCLENEIALYSPHTAYDKIAGGVNDWLIAPYGPQNSRPITPEGQLTTISLTKLNPHDLLSLKSILSTNEILEISENSMKIRFPENNLLDVIKKIKDLDSNLMKNVEIETMASNIGAGRVSKLSQEISLEKAVQLTKSNLGLPHIRLALGSGKTKDSMIASVAVCAGSGSSVLSSSSQADLWVTGEMSHHEVLDAVHKGTSVILCDHSNTERGYLSTLVTKFKDELFADGGDISFFVSKEDKDPLEVV